VSTSEQKKEDWMNSKWRPAMGWLYMLVCAFDFIFFPILWSLLQSISHGLVTSQWQPLTLQGAGLFHVAMGAVLGIAAYGRTKEKMAGAENGGLNQLEGFGAGAGTTYVPPGQGQVNVNNQAPANFGNNNTFASNSMNNTTAFGGSAMATNSNSFGTPSFGTSPAPGSSSFNSSLTSTPVTAPSFGAKPSGPPQSFPEK